MLLATFENAVVRSPCRDRMKFSIPRGAADGPASRITPKRVDDVRNGFTRTCAVHCCSGRSLKCQPARPPNPTTSSARVRTQRCTPAAITTIKVHSHGRTGGGCGFSTAVLPPGSWPSCSLSPGRVATWKFAARVINGRARQPARSSAGSSPAESGERKMRLVDSQNGSPGWNQPVNSELSRTSAADSRNARSPAGIVTSSLFSSGGIGQLQPSP